MMGQMSNVPSTCTGSDAFIPLNLPAILGPAADTIEIVHPRGHLLRVPRSFDQEALSRILGVLNGEAP
jgi:hypothetical protein